jgi:hypothetical protein
MLINLKDIRSDKILKIVYDIQPLPVLNQFLNFMSLENIMLLVIADAILMR